MRKLLGWCALALSLAVPSIGHAQTGRELIHIDGVHAGFMSNSALAQFKSGAWMPVYVDITAGKEGFARAEMIVESADSDDVRSRYTVAVSSMEPNGTTTIIGYARPGNLSSEISVNFVNEDGKTIAKPHSDTYGGMEAWQHIYLSIGSRLHTLRMALDPSVKEDEDPLFTKDNSNRRVAVIEDVRQLPNRWFVYEPIDLMILATGDRDKLGDLLNEQEGRKDALIDWVRHGGRLIVSVGRNQDLVAGIKALQPVLPVSITGLKQVPELRRVANWTGPQPRPFQNAPSKADPSKRPPVDVAKLERKPGREIDPILVDEQEGLPLIVRGSYGLGQVTVVAFDLDAQPFTTWVAGGQRDFWAKLLQHIAPPAPSDQQMPGRGFNNFNQTDQDLATKLESQLEVFDDVPVISFGWVALFILLYILVVGPLDYFFLKKVVKRLELTWITFPTVVITISVVAYFTAYWLKGNDQKINKVDVIDIDAETGTVFGNSWFTIFSPRIQNYIVALEPSAPGWAPPAGAEQIPPAANLTWLGRPDPVFGGTGRGGSQGLFRRAYNYLPEARGLLNVPIQVWSTKSFSACWQAPYDPKEQLIVGNLRYSSKTSPLSGTITNKLPVDLEDVSIYYPGDKWYSIGRLVRDVPQRVDALQVGSTGTSMDDWFRGAGLNERAVTPAQNQFTNRSQAPTSTGQIVRSLFFTQREGKETRNSTMRYLDQSWRLPHKNEVFVVGRVKQPEEGDAEVLTASPAMPAKLWIGDVPVPGATRPLMTGSLKQETYVRMILPVSTVE
jgi:hypothetical protein